MRYLTKDWYIACQTDPMTPEVQKRLDEIDQAYCTAQTREALLMQLFEAGVVLAVSRQNDNKLL